MSDSVSSPEELWRGRFVRMVRRDGWEYADRVNSTGIVMLVAVTEARELVLVEQMRPPLGRRCIELPAGLVGDEPGAESEALETAARRELLEEAGYAAGRLEHLFRGAPSGGTTSEEPDFYLATQLQKVSAGGGVSGEQIEVHLVPLSEVPAWLKDQVVTRGVAVDAKIFAGLYFAMTRLDHS